jgi:hypothetical protein
MHLPQRHRLGAVGNAAAQAVTKDRGRHGKPFFFRHLDRLARSGQAGYLTHILTISPFAGPYAGRLG